MNIEASIATLCIPIIQTDPSNQSTVTTSSNNSYFFGYLVATCVLCLAFVFFVIGREYYIGGEAKGMIIFKWIPILINAFTTKRKEFQNQQTTKQHINSYLDYADVKHQGRFFGHLINETRAIHRALAVFLLLIPYWLIYAHVGYIHLKKISSSSNLLDSDYISIARRIYEKI